MNLNNYSNSCNLNNMPTLCEQWHCIYCGNKFPTKIALKIHFSEHREKMEYSADKCCCSCGKYFSEFHYFENHLLQTGHMNDNPNLILMQSPTNLVGVTNSSKSNNSIMNINSTYCQPSSAVAQIPNMILSPKDRSSSFHSLNSYNNINNNISNNNSNNIANNNINNNGHMKPLYEGPALSLPRSQYSQQSLTSLVENTNRTNNSYSSYGNTTAATNTNAYNNESNYSSTKSNLLTIKEYGILYFCGESSSAYPSTGGCAWCIMNEREDFIIIQGAACVRQLFPLLLCVEFEGLKNGLLAAIASNIRKLKIRGYSQQVMARFVSRDSNYNNNNSMSHLQQQQQLNQFGYNNSFADNNSNSINKTILGNTNIINNNNSNKGIPDYDLYSNSNTTVSSSVNSPTYSGRNNNNTNNNNGDNSISTNNISINSNMSNDQSWLIDELIIEIRDKLLSYFEQYEFEVISPQSQQMPACFLLRDLHQVAERMTIINTVFHSNKSTNGNSDKSLNSASYRSNISNNNSNMYNNMQTSIDSMHH